MKLGQKLVTCSYNPCRATDTIEATDTSANATGVNQNQENTGYLAVTLDGDNQATNPTPRVKLASAAGEYIYGVVATINAATGRCGVITDGIVPIKKTGNSVAGDLGFGILGGANGRVGIAGAGLGRGTIVGRVSDTSPILWVDLDVNANAVS